MFVLFDKTAKIYAGLAGTKIITVESESDAVKFDVRKDNPAIKCSFYSAVTGANFQMVTI